MLGLTDNHLNAIAKHIETMNFDPIVVGSVVKIADHFNKNLKFVVIATAGDVMQIVWKTQLTNVSASVTADSIITRNREELIKLAGTVIVPAAWANLVA